MPRGTAARSRSGVALEVANPTALAEAGGAESAPACPISVIKLLPSPISTSHENARFLFTDRAGKWRVKSTRGQASSSRRWKRRATPEGLTGESESALRAVEAWGTAREGAVGGRGRGRAAASGLPSESSTAFPCLAAVYASRLIGDASRASRAVPRFASHPHSPRAGASTIFPNVEFEASSA